jgi:hypothetical protein
MKIMYYIILLFVISTKVFAGSANDFESITAGFKVTKPNDWQFITAQENIENIKRVDLLDKEFHEKMIKYSQPPLVAMMKYPEPFDDVNPSFKINIKPLGQLKGLDPKQILGIILPQIEKTFKKYKLVIAPKDTKISGLSGAYMKMNYSMVILDGRELPATSEIWIVPRGDYFFLIGAGSRQDESTDSRVEIQNILSSISL